VVVTPRPGVAIVVELPLVAAGEVSGYLVREGGKIMGGLDVELLDAAGRMIRSTRSEYDGFFLFERVPYGQYRLRVGAMGANIVGVQSEIAVPVRLDRAKPTVDMGTVQLKPATRIAASE
jgi:hypothetical protein